MRNITTLVSVLLLHHFTAFSQKPIKTPSKEMVFNNIQFWEAEQNKKLAYAPAYAKQIIESSNLQFAKSGKSLRFGYTPVFDLPLEKITGFIYDGKRNIDLGDLKPLDGPPPPMCLAINATAASPRVDMRDYGIITPVRFQDSCGGCWSFATAAAFETATLLKNGGDATALQISVAQLMGCAPTFPGACGGGIQGDAVHFMKNNYLATESEFPFAWPAIRNVSCNNFRAATTLYKARAGNWVTGSVAFPSPSIAELKASIIRYGSVAASIHSTENFQRYAGGVYDLNDNPTVFPNHVVQIIGWDDELQAWLIKNSWSAGWGIGGFGWVRYGTNVIGAYAVWIEAEANSANECVTVTNNPNVPATTTNPTASYEQLLARFPYPQIHRIQSVFTNGTVEVDDPVIGAEKGIKIQQWEAHGPIPFGSDGHNQEWWFLPAGRYDNKPAYRILNHGFNKYLTDNGGVPRAEFGNGGDNQLWFIENTDQAGAYFIKNKMSGKYLDFPTYSRQNGVVPTLSGFNGGTSQKFRVTSVNTGAFLGDKENSEILIVPAHATHMTLDLSGGNYSDNNQLSIWQWIRGNRNSAFEIKWDNDARAYSIFSRQRPAGNKSVEVYGFSRENTGRVVVWEKVSGENQFWYIIPVVRDRGKYIILNKLSGKALDVGGAGNANGTLIVQWDYAGGNNQKWEFRRWE